MARISNPKKTVKFLGTTALTGKLQLPGNCTCSAFCIPCTLSSQETDKMNLTCQLQIFQWRLIISSFPKHLRLFNGSSYHPCFQAKSVGVATFPSMPLHSAVLSELENNWLTLNRTSDDGFNCVPEHYMMGPTVTQNKIWWVQLWPRTYDGFNCDPEHHMMGSTVIQNIICWVQLWPRISYTGFNCKPEHHVMVDMNTWTNDP